MKKIILVFFLGLLASFIAPFTYWPEMFNWPFFMSHGWWPYKDIAIIHTPILTTTLWLTYQIFGDSSFIHHLFGSCLLALTAALIAKVSRSYLVSLLFIFLALAFNGNHVWFESLLTPFMVLIFYYQSLNKILMVGFLFGLAILTKQTAAYLLPAIIFPLLFSRNFKQIILLFFSTAFPIVISLVMMMFLGILPDFLNWGVKFIFVKPYVLLPHPAQIIVLSPLVLMPLFFLWRQKSKVLFLNFIWLICGLLFAFPRFDYFHLVPVIPFFLFGLPKRINLPVLVLTVIMGSLILSKNLTYFHSFLEEDVLAVAADLKNNYSNKTLFVLNGPDQLYYLTGKMPAVKPWVPQLPWYLTYYGEKFFDDFVMSPPDVIVLQPYLEKPIDGLGAYKPREVLTYVSNNYHLVKTYENSWQILERN